MIIKILKGRRFGGLLDYLFDPQNKPPPQEIEARVSHEIQGVNEEPLLAKEHSGETEGAGPIKERASDNSAEGRQRGDADETGNAERKQRGELLITNMAGRSKEELREHFEALAALRPDVEVNVLHGILSMPEEDALSRETKVRIVLRFAELKGLDRTMFAAIEHEEEGHRHTEIHVISSTINFKGRLPSDSFDYDKGEAIARQLEKEFDLKPNKSSRDSMSRAPTQGEWKQHKRTGKLSRPLRLQALVNSALDREITFTDFNGRLERRGVLLHLLVNDEGKVAGSVYEFEGKYIKGRRLGRGFTWSGLQQNWPDQQERKGRIIYEPERDHEAFSRSRSGAVGRGRIEEPRGANRSIESISGYGAAHERTGREAGAHRKSAYQTPAISEEGRASVRDNRTRGKGTARRGDRTPQRYGSEPHAVQRASDDDGGRDQGRVPAPTPNASSVLRRDDEDKRQERRDGDAMPEYGGDEQRSLSKRQRRGARNIGENTGTPQSSRRRTSQGDRGAGAPLQDDLQAIEQADLHWGYSDSHVRIRRGNNGRRNVVLHEGAQSAGDKSLEFGGASESNKNGGIYSEALTDALPEDGGAKTRPPSAVDQVIETLWGGSSRRTGKADQSTGSHTPKGDAKEIDNYPKQPDIATPAKTAERETLLSKSHPQLESAKDQTDSPQAQGPSQGKQDKYEEHGRRSGSQPNR